LKFASSDFVEEFVLTSPDLAQLEPVLSPDTLDFGSSICHGFFTRKGGVSEGIFASLNVGLGSEDQQDHIETNRDLICQALGADTNQLATVSQIHSADAVIIEQPFIEKRPRADALVTKVKGLAIGILTADCGPVLFADAEAGVIGAAHAGWKGAMGGVLENTVLKMIKLGASRDNIVATLGPCISQANYEVGPEYLSTFLNADMSNNRYFVSSANEGHSMFDLASYIMDRLLNSGIRASSVNLCTYQHADRFYSYRRSVHNNEPDYGRQISAIMLR
jgi:YfiH family protein